MELKNNLYNIADKTTLKEGLDYTLSLHADCPIYAAHFPGKPVTPGVCLLMVAKELLGDALNYELTLSEVKNAKFLSVVSPAEDKELVCEIRNIEIYDDDVYAKITMRTTAEVKAKMSIMCTIHDNI